MYRRREEGGYRRISAAKDSVSTVFPVGVTPANIRSKPNILATLYGWSMIRIIRLSSNRILIGKFRQAILTLTYLWSPLAYPSALVDCQCVGFARGSLGGSLGGVARGVARGIARGVARGVASGVARGAR